MKKNGAGFQEANLVLSHGKTAAIVLASKGIGPKTASRVIGKLRRMRRSFTASGSRGRERQPFERAG
ncbi:Uncharacterised protein [uncultured archaeon]|nr:Uncharacterised protein [uncultured archaeon]